MTTDRFYGGVSNRLELLERLLKYINENDSTRENVIEWILSNTNASSSDAVNHHLAFLSSINLISFSESRCRLGKYGVEFLEEEDSDVLYEALNEGVKGFDTILRALAEESLTDEEIRDLLVAEFEDAEMETTGPAVRHREWLQVLGYLNRNGALNEISEKGRIVIGDRNTSLRLEREQEKIEQLRSKLLETEMECIPAGEQNVSTDIYPAVQSRYPNLCNDDFRCYEAHDGGRDLPEWKHAVRNVQKSLADRESSRVNRLEERGMWLYGPINGDVSTLVESEHDEPLPEGTIETTRRETTTNRVQRDRGVVREMKNRYDDICMICGNQRKQSHGDGFSHVHHLKPLGEPHGGPDIPENTVVTCPNHHYDFEHGMLTVDPVTHEIQHSYENEVDGRTLRVEESHELGSEYLAFHNQVIAGGD